MKSSDLILHPIHNLLEQPLLILLCMLHPADKDVFRFDKVDLAAAYTEVARRIVPEIFE